MKEKKAYLILENGIIFEGKGFGYEKETIGEVAFNTSVVGYLETLTDPNYSGQMVVQTFPLIGNYGVIKSDFESGRIQLNGYIVREWCHNPSNFRCEGDIDTFLKENKVPGLYGIDTRKLTKIIRQEGVMNGMIAYSLDNIEEMLKAVSDYKILNAVKAVTVNSVETIKADNEEYRVVIWNMGARTELKKSLANLNCSVIDVPAETSAEAVAGFKPDGVVISDGPGNPQDNSEIINEIEKFLSYKIPVFGTGLGHQLIALAKGAETSKLHYGHRGSSQPVRDKKTERIYITAQNHGYYVVSDTLPDSAFERFVNVNDNTCEGIEYKDMPVISVQFQLNAVEKTENAGMFYGAFIDLMKEGK